MGAFPVTMRVRVNYLSKFKFNFSKKSRNCQKISQGKRI